MLVAKLIYIFPTWCNQPPASFACTVSSLARTVPSLARAVPSLARTVPSLARALPSLARTVATLARDVATLARVVLKPCGLRFFFEKKYCSNKIYERFPL